MSADRLSDASSFITVLHQDKTKSNLEKAIENCDERSLNGEIKGYVFYKEGELIFRETSNGKQMEIADLLDKYVHGNFVVIDELVAYGQETIKAQEEMGADPMWVDCAHKILDDLKDLTEAPIKQITADQYKQKILSTVATFDEKDIPFDEPGFIGLYHVHTTGNPPSPQDIGLSKRIPVYTLAVKSDGMDFYAHYNGGYMKVPLHLETVTHRRGSPQGCGKNESSNYFVTLDNGTVLGWGWLEVGQGEKRSPLRERNKQPSEGQTVFLTRGYNSSVNPKKIKELEDKAYTIAKVEPG